MGSTGGQGFQTAQNCNQDDFRTVTEYTQPIRFIVSSASYEIPSTVRHVPEEKATQTFAAFNKTPVNLEDTVQVACEVHPVVRSLADSKVFRQDAIEVVSCSSVKVAENTKDSSPSDDRQLVDGGNKKLQEASHHDISMTDALPVKARDSKTLISLKEKSLTNDETQQRQQQQQQQNQQPQQQQSNKADEEKPKKSTNGSKKAKKANVGTFRDRQMELHRFRVDVEKKRLELLELKLTREREEIMHERVKFERDLEYKELVIKQIKEEVSLA